jgi:hypothetical protein
MAFSFKIKKNHHLNINETIHDMKHLVLLLILNKKINIFQDLRNLKGFNFMQIPIINPYISIIS